MQRGEREEGKERQRANSVTKKMNVSTTQLGLLPPAIRNFSTPENYYSSCIALPLLPPSSFFRSPFSAYNFSMNSARLVFSIVRDELHCTFRTESWGRCWDAEAATAAENCIVRKEGIMHTHSNSSRAHCKLQTALRNPNTLWLNWEVCARVCVCARTHGVVIGHGCKCSFIVCMELFASECVNMHRENVQHCTNDDDCTESNNKFTSFHFSRSIRLWISKVLYTMPFQFCIKSSASKHIKCK